MPKKSWYGLVYFEWVEGEWSYGNDLEYVQININDIHKDTTQLKILHPRAVKKFLYVILAIDGINESQFKHMRNGRTMI